MIRKLSWSLVLAAALLRGRARAEEPGAAPPPQETPEVSATAPPPAPARALRGVVLDAHTGAPVAGATVYLPAAGQEVLTDEGGRFSVAVAGAGEQELAVVDPAYQRLLLRARPGQELTVTLVPLTLVADEVVVVEASRPRPAPGATSLHRAEVSRVPGARGDLLGSVKSLPGVANNGSLTPFSAGVIIRGTSPEDSKILVDGFEIPVLYHFLGVQSVLPSEMIDELEYTPGAFGVEWGRSSAGIISVSSRRGDRAWGGFAELSFVNLAGLVQGPVGERGSFALSLRRSLIDAVLPLALPDDSDLDFTALPRYYDYQGRFDWQQNDRLRLSLFLLGSDDAVQLLSDSTNPTDPLQTGQLVNDVRFTRVIASAHYTLPRFTGVLALSAFDDHSRTEVGSERHLDLARTGFGARLTSESELLPWLTLHGGGEIDVVRWDADVRFPRPPREGDLSDPSFSYDATLLVDEQFTVTDLGSWLALGLRPLARLELRAGARLDAFLRTGRTLVQPRGQATWSFTTRTRLRAAAGLYSRPGEDQDENLETDIDPERALHTSLGLEHSPVEGFTVQTTGFYNALDDQLVLSAGRRDDGSQSGGYRNTGSGTVVGAEFLLTLRRERASAWLAYTLSRSTRRDQDGMDERLFDYDQTHNLVLVGSYRLGADKQWQLGGRFQYTTGRPYTPVIGASFRSDSNSYEPMFGAVNSRRVDAQHQLDLRIDRYWTVAGIRLSAYLDVSNVYLNAAVVDHGYNYDYSERQDITTLPIIPAIGVRGEI
jgi:hypothetical protein